MTPHKAIREALPAIPADLLHLCETERKAVRRYALQVVERETSARREAQEQLYAEVKKLKAEVGRLQALTQAIATTERKREPIGEIVRSFGTGSGLEVRLFGGLTSDTPGIVGTKLYTSPQVPEDTALRAEVERLRLMRPVTIGPTGQNNMLTAGEIAAIDAARKG